MSAGDDLTSCDYLIFNLIKTYPGIKLFEIRDTTRLNRNTVKYHLANLIADNVVTKGCDHGYYLPNSDAIPRVSLEERIIDLHSENPKKEIVQIAHELNISRQLAWYYLNKMEYNLVHLTEP